MANNKGDRDAYEQVGDFISIFKRSNGQKWYAYYRIDGKPVRVSLRTSSKKQARLKALELENRLQIGQAAGGEPPALLDEAIAEYIQYLTSMNRAPRTLGKYLHCFRMLSALAIERNVRRLDGINHRFVDEFRRRRPELSQRVSPNLRRISSHPKTIRNDLVLIRQLINFALRRDLLQKDPLKGLEFGKVPRTPQPFWTKDQVEAIVNATRLPYRSYFRFLAETGARASEAIWLTWDDADFQNGVVHIRAKDGWKPKSGDQRVVPMSATLRAMLERQPRIAKWVFCASPSQRCRQSGRQIDARRALASLKTVLKRLGLRGHQHTFRHSFISHALTSGVAVAVVKSWVGHVDDEIIALYTHIADQLSQQAMQKLSATSAATTAGETPLAT